MLAEVTVNGLPNSVDNPVYVTGGVGGGGGGDASAANQSTIITDIGATNETAPASDTAASGLNGRLQRVAQRLTTMLTGIILAAGENHIGAVGGQLVTVSGTFTRPADTTAYTIGDAVGDSTSALAVLTLSNVARAVGGSGYIVGARLETNLKSITPRFRVRIFNASNPTKSNDNAAFKSVYADASKRLARLDLPAMITPADTTNSDMSSSEDNQLRIPFACGGATRDLYVLFETLDAFTPASGQSFTFTLTVDVN